MTDVNETQLDALVAAADEGVDLDGLVVARNEDGYTFSTPDETHEGLDADEFRATATANPWFVSNWYYWECRGHSDVERAFLRWLEDAAERDVADRYEVLAERGSTASWGQLHIEVALGDHGDRMYTLRHEGDVDRPLETLDVYTDPLDARELVKFDDRGRYRPLKTAPSLPTGWAFVDLDGRVLVRAVEFVYPATVTNWQLERQGELDVSHWEETMARQTGIYGVVETWNRGEGHEHVNWVAEACCDDSQCLKRREWEYDDETDLDVDGGDGGFPCREPCSLVISAARKWTTLEAETSRTYEFELTPSEKEQLEALLDVVADGRVDEVREADISNGANRYRARYLRAKRVDDEGRLCGVPTDRDQASK